MLSNLEYNFDIKRGSGIMYNLNYLSLVQCITTACVTTIVLNTLYVTLFRSN